MAQTKNELPMLEKKIAPIQIKYEFLRENEKDQALAQYENQIKSLPEAWKRFNDNLIEASLIITRSMRQLNQEVDNQIEDYK